MNTWEITKLMNAESKRVFRATCKQGQAMLSNLEISRKLTSLPPIVIPNTKFKDSEQLLIKQVKNLTP